MMLTFSGLRDVIYDWLAPIVAPAPVVWLTQNNPRPNKPYLSARITPSRKIAQDFVDAPDEEGTADVIGNREFTVMLEYVGAGGYDAMERIRTSLEKPTVLQALSAAGVATVDVEDMQDISQIADSRYEDRYMLDARMRTESYCTDSVGLISSVAILEQFTSGIGLIHSDLVTITLPST